MPWRTDGQGEVKQIALCLYPSASHLPYFMIRKRIARKAIEAEPLGKKGNENPSRGQALISRRQA